MVSGLGTKPTNPQEFHVLGQMFLGLRMGCGGTSMIYPKDLGIPVGVSGTSLGGLEHNIGMGAGVDYVVVMADIICSVIYRDLLS